jgi:hypothetical protein
MAILATNLTSGSLGTAASVNTASITPQSDTLILVSVSSVNSVSTTPNIPTVTGCGMTWTQVNTINQNTVNQRIRITLFRGVSASPSTGVLTIDYAGQAQLATDASVNKFVNTDITGTNAANAIVQTQTGSITTGTTLNVTLGAFANAANATFGCGMDNGAQTINAGANMTSLSFTGYQMAEWANNNQTSVNWTWASSDYGVGIAVELKYQLAGGTLTAFEI